MFYVLFAFKENVKNVILEFYFMQNIFVLFVWYFDKQICCRVVRF